MDNQALDYSKMLTDFIQKQILILGPNIALDKARRVPGLEVSPEGSVLGLSGDAQMVAKSLANEYRGLSTFVVERALASLSKKYPTIKGW
jgi:hypothetical protein